MFLKYIIFIRKSNIPYIHLYRVKIPLVMSSIYQLLKLIGHS